MYRCPTQEEFEAKLAEIKLQEQKYGVKIDFDTSHCVDRKHLDCIWYGGQVGSIEYHGYKIVIGSYGDIRISGIVDGRDFFYKDKDNDGYASNEFGDRIDDERLYNLFDEESRDGDYLEWIDNNWFEVDLYDPDGNWIDLCGADNVLDNNILDCFSGVSEYFEYVEWAEQENKLKFD